MHERGADRGGGGAHGGKALAHRVHAADRSRVLRRVPPINALRR
jgi:hypothetical protein